MCMIDWSDGCAVLLHARHQKARMAHKCGECGRVIGKGETYLAERTVSDSSASSHKTCAHCQRVRDYLSKACGGWVYGGAHEDMADHYYTTTNNDAKERAVRLLALGIGCRWTRADGTLWPVPTSMGSEQ